MFDLKIPERWTLKKFKHIFKFVSETSHQQKELLSVFLNKGVIKYDSNESKPVHKPSENLSNYQLVQPGDLVLNNQQAWRGSVGVSEYEGIVSPAYYILRPTIRINSRFLNYVTRDNFIVGQFKMASKGVGSIQKQIYVPYLKNIFLPVPPLDEQEKIVRYLDKKTSDMTKFIDAKKKQVELLKELKRSIISDAVTNGIFGDKTPDNWTRKKLKYFATIKNGQDYKEFFDTKGKYPVMGSGGEFSRVTKFLYDKPSVLLGRKGTIDKPIYITEPFWTTDTMYYTVINSEIYPKFFYYLCCQIPFEYYKSGSVLPSMTQTDLYSIRLPSPPLWEQKEIADYLDVECTKIENLIEAIQKEISLVEELRKSLISEVVTGKIDVRELI